MKYRTLFTPVVFGAALTLGLALLVTSCGKKTSEAEKTPEAAVQTPSAVSEKPVASAPETPTAGPQTHEEYVAELGKLAKENQSFGRRVAMADETLKARERVLLEENETVKAAQAEVEKIRALIASAENVPAEVCTALVTAEKALADAFATDSEWAAAKAKMESVSKEKDAALAKTMLAVQEAHKKGIHLRPKDVGDKSEPASAQP